MGCRQETDRVDLDHVIDQLTVKRLAAAIIEPAQQHVGVPTPGRSGAEHRESLVLAVPVGDGAMPALQRAGMHGVLDLKSADHGPRRQQLQLQPVAGHVVDPPDIVLRHLVKDILLRPGTLKTPDHRLCPRNIGHRQRPDRGRRTPQRHFAEELTARSAGR